MTKSLHFMWFQGLSQAPEMIRDTPFAWRDLNPGYDIYVWDAGSLGRLVAERYPSLTRFWSDLGNGTHGIIRQCDFGRLLILHAYGGWYFDLDCVPCLPLSTLLDDGVRHHLTPFSYSENPELRTVLDPGTPVSVDFASYEMILTREHTAPAVMGGFSVCNGCLYAAKESPFLWKMILTMIPFHRSKVLSFAGPHGVTRFLRTNLEEARGRVLVLPPYYFLWQHYDMGRVWERTVCRHLNRMDWADHTKEQPWDI